MNTGLRTTNEEPEAMLTTPSEAAMGNEDTVRVEVALTLVRVSVAGVFVPRTMPPPMLMLFRASVVPLETTIFDVHNVPGPVTLAVTVVETISCDLHCMVAPLSTETVAGDPPVQPKVPNNSEFDARTLTPVFESAME